MKLLDRVFGRTFGSMESAVYRDDREALASFSAADLAKRDKDGSTLLMVAISSSEPKTALIRLLIERGCDVNAKDALGWTALHLAARNQNSEIVCLLLQAGASPNEREVHGNTPLLRATSKNSNPSVLKSLIQAGADPTVTNNSGVSPLSLARTLGREDLIAILGG